MKFSQCASVLALASAVVASPLAPAPRAAKPLVESVCYAFGPSRVRNLADHSCRTSFVVLCTDPS